jgi:hypothetical protein
MRSKCGLYDNSGHEIGSITKVPYWQHGLLFCLEGEGRYWLPGVSLSLTFNVR